MLPHARGMITWANEAAVPVIVETNQADVGRGYCEWCGFREVQKVILESLSIGGAHIHMVLACAYHQDGTAPYAIDNYA